MREVAEIASAELEDVETVALELELVRARLQAPYRVVLVVQAFGLDGAVLAVEAHEDVGIGARVHAVARAHLDAVDHVVRVLLGAL